MKKVTTEWMDRVEGDWKVARREIRAADPVYNIVCFLSQQCAEKHIKAFLEEHDIPFGKTHDLVVLLSLTGGRVPELEGIRSGLAYLSPFAIAARYPGVHTDRQVAERACDIAEQVRAIIREKLGLR